MFEKSVGNKVKKPGSSRSVRKLNQFVLKWHKHKYRRMDSDNFDEFLLASKSVGNAGITILMFNNKFQAKVSGNWYRETRFVENDEFKIVNENQEYEKLWSRVILDKEERYRTLKLSGARFCLKEEG
jgi:hypothetical protein